MKNNRYKIIKPLGQGGMGQTYIVEDVQHPNNLRCVLKQLKPANSDANFLATAQRLFKTEAEKLKMLRNHPQIPTLLDEFEENGEFYIVQEFIDGHPLSREMPLGERWPESQVINLLKELLLILQFIHEKGVIHRDIKPDNIIRRRQDNKLVLIDFGAVKQIRWQTTAMGQISQTVGIGTIGYMPMEQASGKPLPCSDIYALGIIAIQALTGLLPSQLRNDHQTGELVWQDQAEVSSDLLKVVDKMTKTFYTNRYQSATEILQALEQIELGYTPTMEAKQPLYTPTTPSVTSETEKTPREVIEKTEQIKTKVLPSRREELVIDHHAPQNWWKNKILFTGVILLSGYVFYTALAQSNILVLMQDLIGNEQERSHPSPENFITDYFKLINRGDYNTAWSYLTPKFQAEGGGYEEYIKWWTKVESVTMVSTNVISSNENEAIISVEFQFNLKTGRASALETKQYLLKYNLVLQQWQIDDGLT